MCIVSCQLKRGQRKYSGMKVTIQLIIWIFNAADRWLGNFFGFKIPGLGLLVTLGVILLVGVFSIHFFGRVIFRMIEVWFNRLPIIRRIYPALKQAV